MTNLRPLGDAACDEVVDGTWPPFGVFGLLLACVALKLSSSIPCGDGFGKLGLSYSALLWESMTIDSGFSVSQLISHHTLPQNRFWRLINDRLRAALQLPPKRKWFTPAATLDWLFFIALELYQFVTSLKRIRTEDAIIAKRASHWQLRVLTNWNEDVSGSSVTCIFDNWQKDYRCCRFTGTHPLLVVTTDRFQRNFYYLWGKVSMNSWFLYH